MSRKPIQHGLPPETPSHQEYYKEPFTAVEGGYGYEGVLTITEDETRVQCHLCGYFFVSLGAHLQHTHKMKAREYKERFGLRVTKGLVAPKQSKIMAQRIENEGSLTKLKRLTGLYKGRKALERKPKKRQRYALENKNLKGTCPQQLLDKVRTIYDMHGEEAGLNKFREVYGGGAVEAVYRTYGSWRNAVWLSGNQVNKPKQPMTREQFRLIARDFYDRWERKPSYRDYYNRRDVPSHTVLYKLFGSYSEAMKYCFNDYPLTTAGARKAA